ncbi:hypothetical protein NQZ79_g6452 [Umbelopsis isabellina]|nr:hypothetical protein NQZ79_g6452 [Umbelopsis isabellina]
MHTLGLLTLLSSALLVAAQSAIGPSEKDPIFITSPVESSDITSGKSINIKWSSIEKAPETVNIELLENLILHSKIAEGVETAAHEYEWSVPEDLETSTNYAIRIGDGSYLSYSHMFAIKGKGPLSSAPSAGSSTAAAPMSTAAASGSASGSAPAQLSMAPLSNSVQPSAISAAPSVSTEDSVSSAGTTSGSTKLSAAGVFGALAGVAAVAANL